MRMREFLKQRSSVHIAFEISIFFKGLDGVLEIVGGLLLFLVRPDTISRIVMALTQHELSEDRDDIIASYLVRLTQGFSADSQVFAGVYLLSHGGIKVLLVESDTSNPDVWKAYKEHVSTELVNLDEADGWIQLVNLCDANPEAVWKSSHACLGRCAASAASAWA